MYSAYGMMHLVDHIREGGGKAMGNQRHQKNAARDKWIAPGAPVLAQHFNRWTGDVGGWVMSTPKTAREAEPANPGRGRNRKVVIYKA